MLAELKARRNPDRDALVFGTAAGKRDSQSNVRRRLLTAAVKDANARLLEDEEEPISERLTPHGLRHTYASLLAALGENPVHIADQLGHADPAFSLRVYAKTISRRDGELDRLKALVEGTESPEKSRTGTGAKIVAR